MIGQLQFAYLDRISKLGDEIYQKINPKFPIIRIKKDLIENESLILFLFDEETTKEECFAEFPWLLEQLEYSTISKFRIMPILAYHSSKAEPESLFDGELGEFYEEVFSGEFKPFGWDLDSPDPMVEFDRILESYLE